ncbi:MAG: FAD-dependent oxidoreductase [Thermodesulfobacteriota bacterium]|nr:FAD-dependent oxidoreductase [Thermodesulfobacteriota bacterium]
MGKVSLMLNEVECMGCHACEVACKQEHGLGVGPRVIKVIERAPYFKPLFCHHCEDSPCALACPESAITKDPKTGVVLVNSEKCNGCNAVAGKSGAEKQETSACKVGCPAHIDVQGFVSLAVKGKFKEALQLIKLASPFPSICGRVCPHPCESECYRDQIDKPVAIHAIERFLGDMDLKAKKRYVPEMKPKRREKVAIIGSGPAGLTCAYFLAQDGYKVTIFEKAKVLGGMLTGGIPSYRLPRNIVDAEIKMIRNMGVTMKTKVEVGKDKTIAQLRKDGFKAFFLAIGAQESLRLGVPGEDLDGVYRGLDYLRQLNLGKPVRLGERVAVIGGGNVAMDAVRSARRLGSEKAFILYRRGLEEMPSTPEEIKQCREEKIPIKTLAQPVRFISNNGRVKAIECIKMRLTEPDESGRRKPEPILGSEFTIKVEAVITALGQESDWCCLTPECACTLTEWGTMKIDPLTFQSDDPDIFTGGDAARGPKTVIEAIADGRHAAISINRYLSGENLRLGRDMPLKAIEQPQKGKYDRAARAPMPYLEPKKRIKNFNEVQKGLTKGVTLQEAKRCISCGTCCVQTCPYDVMQFNHEVTKAVKCDLCVEKRGRNEIPACYAICPTRCIFWGNPKEFPKEVYAGL